MPSSLFPQRNNPMNMLQQFNQFRQQMAGKDPEAIVKNMLSTGQMSQQQYEQLANQARQLSQFLK